MNRMPSISLKKFLSFNFLFLISNLINAQSNHTIGTFTNSTADFNAAEKYAAGDNVDYYVTYDATYIYFGAFRTSSNTWLTGDHFTIYVDADPTSSVTSGGNFITLTGHDPRTVISDTAVASLITKGFVVSLPLPMKFTLLVSYCVVPNDSPSTVTVCIIYFFFSSLLLGLLDATMQNGESTYFVFTNKFENAGCTRS